MSDCLILYLLDHNACIAVAESTKTPEPDNEWSIQTYIIQLACNRPTILSKTESIPAITWLSSGDHLLRNDAHIKNNGIEAS